MLLIISLFFYATLSAAQNKNEGEVCYPASGGNPAWICKETKNCPTARRLMDRGRHPPVKFRCRFKGATLVPCCPPYDINDWTDPTPLGSKPTKTPPISVTTPSDKVTETPFTTPEPKTRAAIMCKKYSDLIYYNDTTLQLFLGSNQPIRTKYCDNVEPTIFGGQNASAREFPHMALIGYGPDPKWLCGGSLISERFILSAAHCERHKQWGLAVKVLLGELDLSQDNEEGAEPRMYDIARRIPHPKYRPTLIFNDIMLIELTQKVAFNLAVRPLCLHESFSFGSHSQAFVTGWGRIDNFGRTSSILQKVKVPFVSHQKCYDAYKANAKDPKLGPGVNDKTQLCAGSEKGKDSCSGDSGGPLQILLGDCIFSQIGVVSVGLECGMEGVPGIYTRVSEYVPWIENIVWPDDLNRRKNATSSGSPWTWHGDKTRR